MSGHGAFGDVADFRNSRDAVTIDFACEPDRDDTGTIGILPLELQLIVFVPSSLMPFLFTMNIGTSALAGEEYLFRLVQTHQEF